MEGCWWTGVVMWCAADRCVVMAGESSMTHCSRITQLYERSKNKFLGCRMCLDSLKLRLRKLLLWAGILVVCVVFNLFTASIPQAGLSRIERGRQGLVPDFKLPREKGAGETLCELKYVNACITWYLRNTREEDKSKGS